eukprot:TRINITY_DN3536_c0_g1_i1.p1 TRINITY_DN3536_c0_g1~~TRINITY_DN3536_c0_g1_i1.p1  ORF type:complete len:491 (+),score=116.80 TRINITY_DN3536_c0_g1_i1:391-1863(+)
MLVSSSLKLRVIQGRGLLACDSNGKSDPYAVCWIDTEKKKTHTKKKTLEPKWDETFVFPVNSPNDTVKIEVYDWDMVGKDDAMGGCQLPLYGLTQSVEKVFWVPLSTQGEIEIGITAIGFDSSGMHPQVAQQTAAIQGQMIDATQVNTAVFAPPQRWEIKDPEKFYEHERFNHHAGWIQLFLNKPYYIGGEQVMGRVDLFLNVPVNCRSVSIKWTGWEKTYIENTVHYQDGDQWKTRVDVYQQEHAFFRDNFVLFTPPGNQLAPGMHTYNFAYNLPPNLPSVFFEKYTEFDGDKIKAAVVYQVKAYVDVPNAVDIKVKEKLIISELLTQRVLPVSENKVKSFAFAKGKLQFTGEIGKNVFCPGEIIPVKIKVKNPTNKKVKTVKVKLHRKLKVKAQNFSKSNKKEVTRWEFPGIPKQTDQMDVVLNLTLPSEVYPSTNGDLIRCEYYLDIELDIPWAFDLNIAPKVVLALLPAPGQPVMIWNNWSSMKSW